MFLRDVDVPLFALLNLKFFPLPYAIVSSFFSILPYLVFYYSSLLYYSDLVQVEQDPLFKNESHIETFDFIVVGGGSAGSIIANRLSRHNKVLLIESGGDPHPCFAIPALAIYLLNQRPIDWMYKTTPQRNACLGLKNRQSNIPRGQMLGGSSSLNYMIYMRGNPKDYLGWSDLTGDIGWSYENVVPFFKTLEDYHGFYEKSEHHSTGGPMHIEKLRKAPGLVQWLQTARQFGFNVSDANGYQTQTFVPLDVTMKNGRRFSTFNAYLQPIQNRENLKIYRYSQAVKIHLDKTRRAYGVTYIRHGVKKFVRAKKEVIVSAGAINSPKLLMLSGIGPKEHLHSVGLKCRVNLPVGKNLQDHLYTIVGPFLVKKNLSVVTDRDITADAFLQYIRTGHGPLAFGGLSAAGFMSSTMADQSWPDLQFLLVGLGLHREIGHELENILNFKRGILTQFYGTEISRDAFSVNINVARPKSFGDIRLKNSNPFEPPLINPNYFGNKDDLRVMLEGVDFILNFFEKSKSFQRIGARLSLTPFPPCRYLPFRSPSYWRCFVQHFTSTLFHQCGTCRMGKSSNDSSAVLDSNMRVLKTFGLRVIDASIIPQIPNGNLNGPVMMIAERGSFLIREYWAKQFEICDKYEILKTWDENKCFYSKLV